MKIALGIQYDGTPFSGWQVQPDRPTVQQTLEEALGAFAGIGQPVPTICAGRTDTGVHATGQVVHIEAPDERLGEGNKQFPSTRCRCALGKARAGGFFSPFFRDRADL